MFDITPLPFLADLWIFFFTPLAVLLAFLEGPKRSIGFWGAFLIGVAFTPMFGYLIIGFFPAKNRRGCNWCGNTYNEAEYCGLCGKNEAGEISWWYAERERKKREKNKDQKTQDN